MNNTLQESFETTPMMKQYLDIKKKYPNELLFFRMGDFFELFFEDAKIASTALNIALTTRNKYQNIDVPMCGVPYTSMDYHLSKLIKCGYKIAICDQVESPEEAKKRGGYKAVVKREIVRIVTPGTLTEETLLDAKSNNFLMSIVPNYNQQKNQFSGISFAVIDISTDQFYTNTVTPNDFLSVLSRFNPKEILVSEKFENSTWLNELKQYIDCYITILPNTKFNPIIEQKRLENYFNIATLDGIGFYNPEEISACGSIIEYVQITQCENVPQLSYPQKSTSSKYMIIDASTSKNLEIINSNFNNKNTLLYCLDNNVTAFGGRTFASRLMSPLLNIDVINSRLDSVNFWIENYDLMIIIRDILKKCPDIERSFVRLKFGKSSVRDICCVRSGLRVWNDIKNIFTEKNIYQKFENKISLNDTYDFSAILEKLENALEEEIPIVNNEGKIIKSGFSKELDHIREITNNSHTLMMSLQQKYSSQLDISTLKIKNNNIWGWYIEIPLSQKNKMTSEFSHKQTLVNCVRYVTDELIDLQVELNKSSAELVNIENTILLNLIKEVVILENEINNLVAFFSILDISTSIAKISKERNYCRPEIYTDSILEIKDGRHPVLELALKDFVSNNCFLTGESKLSLLTGPNMAGKSTYLRQNAIIILMAQVGLFVPATTAKIGLTDRLFSRIGASDDLAKGRSTFMVEMIETATILNLATEKSFIILDEVGRGTSTYDGLSIAWAVVEYLNNTNKSRVIFATHYMELTKLKEKYPTLKCQTLQVQEWKGNVVFHHKIIDGIADKSYGIYVAQLAGLPKSVIMRARHLLKDFEKSNMKLQLTEQLSIFDDIEQNNFEQNQGAFSLLLNEIADINPDDLSPREALEFIYKLKGEYEKSNMDK